MVISHTVLIKTFLLQAAPLKLPLFLKTQTPNHFELWVFFKKYMRYIGLKSCPLGYKPREHHHGKWGFWMSKRHIKMDIFVSKPIKYQVITAIEVKYPKIRCPTSSSHWFWYHHWVLYSVFLWKVLGNINLNHCFLDVLPTQETLKLVVVALCLSSSFIQCHLNYKYGCK